LILSHIAKSAGPTLAASHEPHDRAGAEYARSAPAAINPRPDHERTLLDRRIEATDRQIDRLVYELYGLTEEEIGLVVAK